MGPIGHETWMLAGVGDASYGGVGVLGITAAALGLGALHALDADHIMAVSTLASSRPSARECVSIALRWSLGHAAMLIALAALAFGVGHSLPVGWAVHSERLVALVLATLGLAVLCDLLTGGARLRLHRHKGLVPHVHWVRVAHEARHVAAGRFGAAGHGAVLVGVMHGAAGSAPLIALIPAAGQRAPELALLFIVVFSLAVLGIMLIFGGVFGFVLMRSRRSRRGLAVLRGLAGAASVCVGAFILVGTL